MADDGDLKLPPLLEFNPETLGGADALFEVLLPMLASPVARAQAVETIRQRWFAEAAAAQSDNPDKRAKIQRTLAGNVISGMRAAGLLTDDRAVITLSVLGASLAGTYAEDGAAAAFDEFASFLLRERYGIELLQAARFLRRRDESVSKKGMIEQLRSMDFSISTGNVNFSRLRDWLAAAKVVDNRWSIDEARFKELAGVSAEEITAWHGLGALQRDVLVTLRLRWESATTPISSKDLVGLLRVRGLTFDESQLRRDVYNPLAAGGWIKHEGAGGGRGGNGGVITLLTKAIDLDVEKIEDLKLGVIPADLREKLGTPLNRIFEDLASTDTHVKGLALELLALRLVGDAALYPVQLRKRGIDTGGAEVDLVAEGAHLHFSRWLFQCKNVTQASGVEVLAKELGMATLLRAQVVVILSKGGFANTVRQFAREASTNTAVQVVLLDGGDLDSYRHGGSSALRENLHQQALQALTLKQPQRDVPVD